MFQSEILILAVLVSFLAHSVVMIQLKLQTVGQAAGEAKNVTGTRKKSDYLPTSFHDSVDRDSGDFLWAENCGTAARSVK